MTDRPSLAVGAVIVEDGKMLIVKRARPPWEGMWAIPGGRVRLGETMSDALIREVQEETGLVVTPGPVAWVGEILDDRKPPRWHYGVIDFFAAVDGGRLAAAGDAEEAQWWPVAELRRLPIVPTMVDLLRHVWPVLP